MKNITIRVTDEDYAVIKSVADFESLPIASYLRKHCLDRARDMGLRAGPLTSKTTAAATSHPNPEAVAAIPGASINPTGLPVSRYGRQWPRQVPQTEGMLDVARKFTIGPHDTFFAHDPDWAPVPAPCGFIPMPARLTSPSTPDVVLTVRLMQMLVKFGGASRTDVAALLGITVNQIDEFADRYVRLAAEEGRSAIPTLPWTTDADRTRWEIIRSEVSQQRLMGTPLFAPDAPDPFATTVITPEAPAAAQDGPAGF